MIPTDTKQKKPKVNIGNVAALLIGASLLGQVLGFMRTKLVNGNFPLTGSQSTDAYFAAFIIPDFFFFTLAAGALGVAFMPVLSDKFYAGDRKGMWELSASLMNMLALLMGFVALIIIVFAKPLIHHLVAPGLPPDQLNTATTIMRFLAFNPLLFTISGIFTSVQQTMGRFFFFAIAPLFYNASIIVSIFIFKDNIGIVGLGLGAMLGAILQLAIVSCGLWKAKFKWHPKIIWTNTDFRMVLRNLPARSLDQGVDQVNDVVETHIASGLGAGAISNYNNAFVLSQAPIMLIGTAISTAAFPRLNARLSQHRPDLFRRDFLMVLRAMIWIAAPIVVACFFCRGYLARLIYTNGNAQIAIIFGFLTAAIFFRIIYSILSRWFYSQKDTRTPLLISLFTIAFNIIAAFSLTRPGGYGVAGLALAQSLAAVVEVSIMSVVMLLRDPKLFDITFWGGVSRIVSVTGFTTVAGFFMISLYPLGINDRGFFTLGSKLFFIAAVIFGTHVALSAVFGLEEVRPVFKRARKLALKAIRS